MKERFLLILLILMLALSACQPAAPAQQETPTGEPAEPYATVVTAEPSQGGAAGGASATEAPQGEAQPTEAEAVDAPPGCTVVSPNPTPGPTERSAFPPVSEEDWVQGQKDAAVTVIEYGDFQ